jgi:hypothetical protein
MKEVGYTNFTLVKNTVDFEYKKPSKIVLWKHWQTSKTLFHNSAQWIWYDFIKLYSGNTQTW